MPHTRRQVNEMGRQTAWYAFLRPEAPRVLGHDALAAGTYLVVFFLFLDMTVTGFALQAVHGTAPRYQLFGWVDGVFGVGTVRWVHHFVMWAILAFMIHHVYSAFLVDHWERNGARRQHLLRQQVRDAAGDPGSPRRRLGRPGDRGVTAKRPTLLVVGVGNVLLRDEGVGVRVAREVAELGPDAVPPGTRVVDGGTLGLDLLPMIEDAAGVVMVDAVDLRVAPGAVAVLRGPDLHAALAQHVSPHQVGVGDLLSAARLAGALPDLVALVAVQPELIEIGLDLTPLVEAAVPAAVDLVRQELEAMAAARRDPPAGVTAG
jgi:hydrogenase maturation protease